MRDGLIGMKWIGAFPECKMNMHVRCANVIGERESILIRNRLATHKHTEWRINVSSASILILVFLSGKASTAGVNYL